MTQEHSAQEMAREALRKILVQADCLERYAEGAGHRAWPVPSVFHLQATHFRDFANEALEALASPPSSDGLREAVERFIADYDDGDRADAGCSALMDGHVSDFRAALSTNPSSDAAPIDMILHCPRCHLQHIDEPDERTPEWSNPPHRSHLCHGCGCIWRPADVPTNGVASIKTVGKADTVLSPSSDAVTTREERLRDFIDMIHEKTPNGEWISVQHHPNGDWSVANEAEGVLSPDASHLAKFIREESRFPSGQPRLSPELCEKIAAKAIAAARVPSSDADVWPLRARIWHRESTAEKVLEIEGVIDETVMIVRHTQPDSISDADVPGLPTLYASDADALREALETLNTALNSEKIWPDEFYDLAQSVVRAALQPATGRG